MNKIIVDLDILKVIIDSQAQKLVGKTCKRFEISNNKEQIKLQIKNLIYESFRDLKDFFENGKILFVNTGESQKEGEQNDN